MKMRMERRAGIEAVLGPLAEVLSKEADTILDLWGAARGGRDPGECVRCFFKLASAARGRREAERERVAGLRSWLEEHIEVVARDEAARELERFAVELDEEEDLAGFCHRAMEEMRENRVYAAERIELRFAFKEGCSAQVA
jgi:hypothetical protein